MDGYGTARLAAMDAESAIVARVCEDFNLSPVLARAHYEQMARYFAEYGQVPAKPGERATWRSPTTSRRASRWPPAARSRCAWS